jgi:hypothetical protein
MDKVKPFGPEHEVALRPVPMRDFGERLLCQWCRRALKKLWGIPSHPSALTRGGRR